MPSVGPPKPPAPPTPPEPKASALAPPEPPGTTATTPRVAVVTNRDGMATGEPIPRDTGMPPWKVTGVVAFKDVRVNLSLDRLLQMV